MKHFVISGVVAAAAFLSVGSPIQAQAYNPFQIGAAAGVAIPTGDFGNDADLGYNVTFAVGYKPQFTPVGVRLGQLITRWEFLAAGETSIFPRLPETSSLDSRSRWRRRM